LRITQIMLKSFQGLLYEILVLLTRIMHAQPLFGSGLSGPGYRRKVFELNSDVHAANRLERLVGCIFSMTRRSPYFLRRYCLYT